MVDTWGTAVAQDPTTTMLLWRRLAAGLPAGSWGARGGAGLRTVAGATVACGAAALAEDDAPPTPSSTAMAPSLASTPLLSQGATTAALVTVGTAATAFARHAYRRTVDVTLPPVLRRRWNRAFLGACWTALVTLGPGAIRVVSPAFEGSPGHVPADAGLSAEEAAEARRRRERRVRELRALASLHARRDVPLTIFAADTTNPTQTPMAPSTNSPALTDRPRPS